MNFTKYNDSTISINGNIINYKIEGNQLQIIIKGKEKVIGFYYFKTEKEMKELSQQLKLGMKIELSGTLKNPTGPSNPYQFNYMTYLKSRKINWIMEIDTLSIKSKKINVFYQIKNKTLNYIESFHEGSNIKLFLFGITDIQGEEMMSTYRDLGVSHLMAVSGSHIAIIVDIILFFLPKKKKTTVVFCVSILFFFAFLVDFTPSVLRAIVMFFLIEIKKIMHWKYNSLELLIVTFFIFLIWNPYYWYHLGFLYSFLVSFSLIYFRQDNKVSYIRKLYHCSLISFLVSMPITINYFYSINVLTPIFNIIYIPYVSFLVFPLSIIILIIPFAEPFFHLAIVLLEWFSNLLNSIPSKISFGYLDMISLLFLIALIIGILYYKKRILILLLVLFLIIHHYHFYLFPTTELISFDVGQGDATLLIQRDTVVLIDTGGKIEFKQEDWKKRNTISITDSILIPYLKARGIHSLSALILTHGDQDHAGEALNLIGRFPIKRIYFNLGDSNELELLIQHKATKENISWNHLTDLTLKVGSIHFYSINQKQYTNENDNSLVLYTKLQERHILLMGDASTEVEKRILEEYSTLPVDILKIGHHGSKTSTSDLFLDFVKPNFGIISVGLKNTYGHPSKEVLEKLYKRNINVLMTSRQGMIRFIFYQEKKYKIAFGAANALAFT